MSPPAAANFSCTTTDIARDRIRTQKLRRPRADLPRACKRAGLGKGDKVVFWSENRPEWIIALWGCLLNGSIAVPIDYRASHEFLGHVARIVDAKLLLLGDDVEPEGIRDCGD